ncbi:MAG TPA: HAD family hydrolase [Polyangiales bacterium]|nr:HAD family hydrolase [Polyangiales bacterium]
MARAPSPKPPAPELRAEARGFSARELSDEDVELTPHFEPPEKPKKPRKTRSSEPGEKPKKPRAKRESGIAKAEAPKGPKPRKSSTPRKKSAPEPALTEPLATPLPDDPLRAAALHHARWTGSHLDRFANPAAPPERQRALDSVMRTHAVVVGDSPPPPPVEVVDAPPPVFAPPPAVQPTPATADVMPYFPSAPCATCATGVDPLRAACVRATERGFEFFCSRSCRAQQQVQERARAQRVEPAPVVQARPLAAPVKPLPSVPPTRVAPKSLEPVARRIVPGRATTPLWPWLAAGASALPLLRQPYATPIAAVVLVVASAAFASRSSATREQAGVVGWLAPTLAVGAFSLAGVLADSAHAKLWIASAALTLLVSWAREHWLERAHALVVALRAELEARSATRVRVIAQDGQASDRALNSLRVGDHVWVEPGSVVPVDGVVEEGDAELLPYPQARLATRRRVGAAVLGGALVIHGALRVRATAVGSKRALFRALATPDRALESVAPSAQRAARVRALAPGLAAVIGAFACALVAPGTASTKLAGLGGALAVLPLLAASRGVLNALQRAVIRGAARGTFFRDGAALERAGQIDTAVLRVEGTLVQRIYTLVEVHAIASDIDRDALLAWALGAEAAADGHPIARAVRRHAATFGIEPAIVRRLAFVRGAGISGLTDGQGALVLGSRAALLQAGVSVAVADREAQQAEQDGHKVVLLALGGHVRGLFVFAQELRGEARLAVQSLFDLGLEVELVAGDHRNTVEALARTLDVLQVKAELTREQRESELRRLRDGEARVAAIGSAEDAGGMLTAADVGVCLEGAPEVHAPGDLRAISHDVLSASSDLRDATHALAIARETRRALRLVWALAGLGGGLALLSALSMVPGWACVLAALAIDAGCLSPRILRVTER